MLVKKAVSARTGTAQIALASRNTGGHSFTVGLFESDVQSFETVETTTLAAIFTDYGLNRVNFLKIDCEGAEYEIFFTASPDIFRRIDKIAMEFHELDAERNGLKMKAFLEQTGLFKVWIHRSLLYALNVSGYSI